MASNSPGGDEKMSSEKNINKRQKIISSPSASGHRARAGARASLSDKVGFFEQVFGGAQSRQTEQPLTNERPVLRSRDPVLTNESRVGAGYHGPRTDARDRSSEDPVRHRIPRASLSPPGTRGAATNQRPGDERAVTNQRQRSRSASRGRDMSDYSLGARGVRERLTNQRPASGQVTNQRRGSRERSEAASGEYSLGVRGVRERLEEDMMTRRSDGHHDDTPSDDIPSSPYRSISIKRTQSGRTVEPGYRAEFKPRALSFRVSPSKSQDDSQDVHQPLQPIFSRVTPTGDSVTRDSSTRDSNTRDSVTRDSMTRDSMTRDPSMSITQHIQAKVSRESLYQKPPPLPERPPRQHQRHSTESSLYSSPRVSVD